jgi:predicted lipid-binding transport protein (Tim44 family)
MARRPVKRKKGLAAHLERGLLSVVLSIVSLLFLIAALVTESILLMLVTGLSVLATAAQVRMAAKRREQQQKKAAAKMPRTPRPAPKPQSGPQKATAERVPAGQIVCTETGKPIDDCDCATRHVATSDGAHRYGLPIGSPIGKKKKSKKPSMTKSSATR